MFFTFLLAWLIAAVIIYAWCYIVEVVLDLPVTGQTPCTAHASLKNIIRRVLRDASNIAILKEPQTDAEPPETTTNRTYEDLLATAILNKVIDNYQTDLRRSSSGSTSSKRSDTSKRHKNRKYDEERWRTSVENPDVDTTSMSSVEEWCRSESSCGSKYVDHTSFTIQQSIEEITTSDDEPSNNQYLHSHNLSRNSLRNGDKEKEFYREDWQDNWLFSRKGKGSPKPVPVPMLVPNPSTDYRALIGDRDAEDTTDLSETGSDLDETDSVQDIKTILVESRTIIGGKNLLETVDTSIEESEQVNEELKKSEMNVAEEASKDSGVDEDLVSEARNNILIHETPYTESDSLSSNTEKDMEYTEKYASIPRQISKEKNMISSPRTSKDSITDQQQEDLIQDNKNEQTEAVENQEKEESEDEEIEEEPPIIIKGSYSEKEREKWRNPVALPNNPYSKENLDKRLNNVSDNDSHLFGRDYYIREAKRAAGGRKKFLDEDDSTTESSGHDFDQESLPVTKEIPKSVDQNVFTAVPAVIKEEEEALEEQDEITDLEESIPSSRPISLALSTDSEDVKIYNLETGKVTTYKNKNFTKAIIEDSKSPEGSKTFINPNELISPNLPNQVNSKFDENQNNSKETNREPIMNISKLNHIINITNNLKTDQPNELSTPITKQEFLLQQISVSEPEIEIHELNYSKPVTSELKDASKKYLQSLVKNNSRNTSVDVSNKISKPLISLQDFDNSQTVTTNNVNTPPISLQENFVENLVEIEKDDTDNFSKPTAFEFKDASKKYLQSLVKNNSSSTPLINLQDLDDSQPVTTINVNTPPISLQENLVENPTEIGTDDTDGLQINHISCIDLRFVGQTNPVKTQLSINPSLLVSQNINGYANSTPNLHDEKLYYSDNDDDIKLNKISDIDELRAIPKPSVRDLKKIFDQEKITKPTISRSKSHLTTKPEFRANRQIHSLTARSLSKEFRRELQKSEDVNDAIIESNGAEGEVNSNAIEEENELENIPPCKSRIEFFEKLKNK